ncbi:MAG: hypothetical protein QGI83_23945, partial [Candidatus Latescibacteria bacterium]|nr:hypothetical protein [Candidatus Latescibacterota bacterium]
MGRSLAIAWGCLAVIAAVSGPIWSDVPVLERTSLFDGETVFRADGSRGPYRFAGRAVIEATELVWVADSLQTRQRDYRVDYGAATLVFQRDLVRGTPILVRFQQIPQVLRSVYRHREGPPEQPENGPVSRPSSTAPSIPRGVVSRASRGGDSELQIGGSKSIQVGFGSDREAELNQSLRVQISGEVAKGVEVLAMLSDRNLPLQAEGRTQSLQELDRVLFQVRSRSLTAGLGDQEVAFDETTFGRYRRRLQGANVALTLPEWDAEVFGAVTEGRWHTRRITPVEGYQGPYRLGGGEARITAPVVAGSERVYLDGRSLRRGEAQDYAVDYEQGLLTFSPSRPISSHSRITVEYQVRDRDTARRAMGFRGRYVSAGEAFVLGTTYLRETDRAGGPASDGSVAGTGGANLHQMAVVDGAYTPLAGMSLSGEVALSSLSSGAPAGGTGSDNGAGRAFRLGLDFSPPNLRVENHDLGHLSLNGFYRQVGARFSGFERIDGAHDEGRWGWRNTVEGEGERSGEMALAYAPVQGLRLDLGYGRRGGGWPARRREIGVAMSDWRGVDFQYRNHDVSTGDGNLSRQMGRASAAIWRLRPAFRFETETAVGRALAGSSLFYSRRPSDTGAADGVGTRELAWEVSTETGQPWSWSSALILRRTRRFGGTWQDSLKSWSYRHRASISGWRGLSASGEYTRSWLHSPEAQGGQRTSDLARIQLAHSGLDGALSQRISYRVSGTGAPDWQPAYLYVGPGQGSFVWEDVDGDGEQDGEEFVAEVNGDYELQYDSFGDFRPVREAALGLWLGVAPRRVLRSPDGAWQRLVAGTSLDLSLEADRQLVPGHSGSAPWHLHRFRWGPEVVSGRREIRGVLDLFRYNRRASFRLRTRLRDRVDAGWSEGMPERLFERTYSGRFHVGGGLDVEPAFSQGNRSREGNGPFAFDVRERSLSVRGRAPLRGGWQVGLSAAVGHEAEGVRTLEVKRYLFAPEIIRTLSGRGRVRGSLDWVRVEGAE